MTGEGLEHLEGLTLLANLYLWATGVKCDALRHVGKLKSLRVLDVSGNRDLTDVDLKHLQGLASLEGLYIGGSQRLSGSGLWRLKGMAALHSLDLSQIGLTDDWLWRIGELTSLEGLHMACTGLKGTGLAELRALGSLRKLNLSRTKLPGRALEQLKGLLSLEVLDLSHVTGRITDADLLNLKELSRLGVLDLTGTRRLSSALAAEFGRALPEPEIRTA